VSAGIGMKNKIAAEACLDTNIAESPTTMPSVSFPLEYPYTCTEKYLQTQVK
jgi:hypothetical protein